MKAALDVFYDDGHASAGCVVFDSWSDGEAMATHRVLVPGVRPYRAGRFFERELSPLRTVLEESGGQFSHIIIDGYVHLKDGRMGLGAHLHEALPYPAVVIGVAKNPLSIADRFETIYRGRSTKALFVSSIGCSVDEAAAIIVGMHGSYRIPTLLRQADQIARGS
jgi:deoxyribonuclease V